MSYRLPNQLYEIAYPLYRPLYGFYKAITEHAERRVIAARLPKGGVVADVGANVGIYSQFLAKRVGPTGIVHTFEPSPSNFVRLRRSLRTYPNIRHNQLAVGDQAGISLLYLSHDLNVDHRLYPTDGDPRPTIPVSTVTLDSYFKPGERLDFIKLDIQGYELHALRGAARVLAQNRCINLLFEFWPYGLTRAGSSAEELTTFLIASQFQLFTFEKSSLRVCDRLTGDPNDITDYKDVLAIRVRDLHV